MNHSAGETSLPNAQTSPVQGPERRKWLRPVALIALGASAIGIGAWVASRQGEAKAPHESVRSVAEMDARHLAGDILDFYNSSPPNAQHREAAGEGDSYLQRATAYRGPSAYNFQLQSVGKGDITPTTNLESIAVTSSKLDPQTGEPGGAPTFDMDISFDEHGISGINAALPGDRGQSSYHVSFHGERAVDENGRTVSTAEVQRMFDQAEQKVAEVR